MSSQRNVIRFLTLCAATVALGALHLEGSAQEKPAKAPPPPQVSKAARKPLVAAQKAATEQKWAECVSNAEVANALPEKSPYDLYAINDILGFCRIRLNDNAGALAAFEFTANSDFSDPARKTQLSRLVLQLSYNAKQYPKAIEYGNRLIASGAGDDNIRLFVAQSHYLQNDFKATREFMETWVRELETEGKAPSDLGIQLYFSSCVRLEDDPCQLDALELQAAHAPKEQTWPNLILILFRGTPEANTLDVFRIARESGALRRGEEYTEMAQLALEKGLPGEAQSILEQGEAANVFTTPAVKDLSKRLLASAKTQATADRPVLVKQERESATNKNGQVDVRIGQAFTSYGQYVEAITAIQRGLAKGNVRNIPDAQLSLGIAQLRAGDKVAAAATFKIVEGDAFMKRLARLWGLRAR